MITTLTGENSFSLLHELQSRTATFITEIGDMGLERLDGQEVSFDRLREAVTSLPFLVARKLVVLRAPSANKQFLDTYEVLLSEISEVTDVIIVEPKLDKRLNYCKYLKKHTDFVEFAELDEQGLSRWLVDTAKRNEGTISIGDAQYLLDRIGVHQQLAANELDKLLLYKSTITRETIDLLTDPTPHSTIFQLVEAAFNGRPEQALALYAEQRALKEEPQKIIGMLSWQIHILALVKVAGDRNAAVIAKEAKLHPYVVGKSQTIANRLSMTTIRSLVNDLLQIDAQSKYAALDLDEALQLYILKLAA